MKNWFVASVCVGLVLKTLSVYGAKEYVVEIGHGHMSPDHLLLETEDRIVFKNTVDMAKGHSIVVSEGDKTTTGPALQKEEQWAVEFNKPGNFTFSLKEHPGVTAKATVFTEDVMKVAITDLRKEMVSYSIGYDLGGKVVKKLDNLDLKLFIAGMQHAYNGEDPKLDEEEMAFIVLDYKRQVARHSKDKFRKLSDKNSFESKTFLAENKQKPGVLESDSGLQYRIIAKGRGQKPVVGDTVQVNYRGTFINQIEFDSTYDTGSSEFVLTSQVLPGLVEGLTLMSEGAKFQIVVPPHLAFGKKGQPNADSESLSIEPNATLLFDIELIKIVGRNLLSNVSHAE